MVTLISLLWRFFTGAHMNGDVYNDSTFWHDASKRYQNRRHSYTWWRRKARWKRAAWRNCFFWIPTLITLGFLWSITLTAVCLTAAMPFIIWRLYGRIRYALFIPVVARQSDQVEQRWIMRPKVRHALEMVKRPKDKRRKPGLATPDELRPSGIRLEDIPTELADAVRLEVSELGEEPPRKLKLLMEPIDTH